MEMEARNQVSRRDAAVNKKAVLDTWVEKFLELLEMAIKVGEDDPTRITIHSLKYGLLLTLASMVYSLEPPFGGIGETAIFIGIVVSVAGSAAAYMRFFPRIESCYRPRSYGILIFCLTFILIAVLGTRVPNVLKAINEQFFTVVIGCGVGLLMSLFIFPMWSGLELHNSTVSKLEFVADSVEACVNKFFEDSEIEDENSSDDEDPFYKLRKSISDKLSTKAMDEKLALIASWEPKHLVHRGYKSQWEQYVELGAVLGHDVGCPLVTLHDCLRAPRSLRDISRDPCTKVAREISKTFKELANSLRNKRHLAPILVANHLQKALQDINNIMNSQHDPELSAAVFSFGTFLTSLVSIVMTLDIVTEHVKKLGSSYGLKE